jgi:hypothetical protein
VTFTWFQLFLILLAILVVLAGVMTLGLSLRPRPFRPHPAPSHLEERAPIQPGLPAPVQRHFSETLGENPPRVQTAVVWGRGKAIVRGVWIHLRFKAWYRPGEAFLRRMEFTFYLRPVMRGTERYASGVGGFELGEEVDRGPIVDHDQALALWAEAVWMPSVFVHDPRVRWEAVDAHSARLVVPIRGGEQAFMVFFDPLFGCMTHLTAERLSSETNEPEPWRFDLREWKHFHGLLLPCEVTLAWGEAGSPWLYMTVDGVSYNVNVSDQV